MFGPTGFLQDVDVLTLGYSGTYTLLIEGGVTSSTSPSYQFNVDPRGHTDILPFTGTEIALGSTVSGVIETEGEQDDYIFTLTEPKRLYFDSFSEIGGSWSLTYPGGGKVVERQLISSVLPSNPVMSLDVPGTYQARVSSSWTGPYSFRLLDVDNAAVITAGTPVAGTLDPGNETDAYQFTAQAGDRFYFDSQSFNGSAYWRLLDPYDRVVFGPVGFLQDVNVLTLGLGGTYTLLIEGVGSGSSSATYQFNVQPVTDDSSALVVGASVSGSIAHAGQQDTYTFMLPADARLVFDALTDNNQLQWTLSGPRGTEVSDLRFTWSDSGGLFDSPTLDLFAGAYTLTVDGSGDAAGPYAFRLLDLASAIPFIPGTPVTGTLDPGNETDAYQFTAKEGNRFYFDSQSFNGTAIWHLLDPYDRVVFGPRDFLNDRDVLALGYTGTYTLLIEGRVFAAAPAAYQFNVFRKFVPKPIPIATSEVQPAPDLTVTDLGVSATGMIHAGAEVTVAWKDTNSGALPAAGPWVDRVVVWNETGEIIANVGLGYEGQPIAAGESVQRQIRLRLPEGSKGAGQITFSVTVDVGNAVGEENPERTAEFNNVAAVTVASTLSTYPDLQVQELTVSPPTGWEPGSAVTLSWTTVNTGNGTAQGPWSEQIYIRNIITNEVLYIVALPYDGDPVGPGEGTARQHVFAWPAGQSSAGRFEFIVAADTSDQIFESNADGTAETNNASRLEVIAAADLAVEVVVAPTTARSGDTVDVSWRVHNVGERGTDAATWRDRVVLSEDAAYDAGDRVLSEVVHIGAVARDGAYTVHDAVFLPGGVNGTFYILVFSDVNGAVYENGLTNNNVGQSLAPIDILPAIAPDLQVVDIVIPPEWVLGQQQDITWTVRNAGDAAARAPWTDWVYLAFDGSLSTYRSLAEVQRTSDLPMGESYTTTARITLPDTLFNSVSDGNYRVIVSCDAYQSVFEDARDANNIAASAGLVAVTHPDLALTAVVTPGTVVSGGPSTIQWTVANTGTGPALGTWTDALYLSRDDVVGWGDLKLAELSHTGPLVAGASYTSGAAVDIPLDSSGDYWVLVWSDSGYAVSEGLTGEWPNNMGAGNLQVTLAPYADLAVSNVVAPALTIADPASVTVTWTVTNQGTGVGRTTEWTDAVVASRDAISGNADDRLLARFSHAGGMAVGESYTRSETFLLPPAFEGRYTLFVRTDVDGLVFENGIEGNNAAAASGFFDVMTIPYADLVVDAVTPTTPAYSGEDLTITWVVRNQGIGLTNTYNWWDVVYLATTPDGSDRTYVDDFDHIGFLAPGGSYTRTGRVALPDGIEGTYYAFVQTGGPFEFVYTDNNSRISGPIEVRLTTPPDLVVSDIVAPETAPEGSAIDVTWTVLNQGQGDANGPWVDRIFLRKFGETGAGTPIGSFTYHGPLQAGTSYTRREQITLPGHVSDQFEILVVTDADRKVYEHTREDNNQSVDDTRIAVTVLPRPDLQVASITGPAVVDAGATASIEFTVINQGPLATSVPNWTDRVYLSLDDKITSDDIIISSLINGAALAPGEQYLSVSDTFEIPRRFRGTVYALVMTDQDGAVDEWPNETNNVRLHPIYVNPWPFADLVVSDVVAPAQTFEGSEVEVRYTVTNLGSGPTDQGEWSEHIWFTRDKNRPHPGLGDVLLKTLQYAGGPLNLNAGYDRVVTVTLPDSLTSGTYYIMPWVDPYAILLEDTLAINVNPDDPNEVNNNNYKARAIDLIGLPVDRRPDPMVQSVTAEAFEYAGEEFTFAWTVGNLGPGAADGRWYDEVYLSNQPVFDETDPDKFLLGRFDPVSSLGPGEAYTNTQTQLLSPAVKGQYVHVRLWVDLMHPEDRDLTNNVGTAVTEIGERIPDLVVTDISLPAEAYSGEKTTVTYTITNTSDQPVWRHTDYWTDRIFLSKDPTFIPDDDRVTFLAEVPQANTGPLAGGDSYTREVEVILPPGIGGDFYVYVFCNVLGASFPGTLPWPVLTGPGTADLDDPAGYPYDSYAYEFSLNNMGQEVLPVVYREPDLRVTDLVVPDSIAAGETVSIDFTVTNVGTRDTREEQWLDRIYLSRDPSLDKRDILMSDERIPNFPVPAEFERQGVLKAGESYNATVPVTMPFDISGPFYVLAYTDSEVGPGFEGGVSDISPRLAGVSPGYSVDQSARVREFQGEGNNLTAISAQVTPFNAPDLQVTALTAPERAVRGQSFDLTYTVTNLGGASPFQQPVWQDLIYLSRDTFLDLRADRFLTSVLHTDGLTAGGAYVVNRTLTVPTDMPTEAYYVFVITDPARYTVTGDLFEGTNERNNDLASAVPMVIELPPPTDLVVTDILVPAQARVGEPVHFEWTVTNQSIDVPAAGTWTDSLFLSTDATWDIADRPLGRAAFTGTLAPGEAYTLTLDTTLPPASPGPYRVIARTDIFNQVHEDVNEANNRTASADTLSVAVDELQIGVPLSTQLAAAQQRLYRITVPADQTLRVTLRAADDKSTNEIFVRHDAVPTSAAFDATYEGPLGSDLSALVPSTEPGAYYLLVRNFSAPPQGTDITLLAELLPLAITNVHTDAGGDSRHVTTTIRGAQFHPDAILKLVRPGIAEYEPLDWQVVDSSKIIATFDFTGAPHGLYDLKVINPSGDQAVIPYRFLVERAIEPEVTIGIGGPRVILAG
ncbi:MAG: CARDB domain-containing protein [bacterium]